MTHARANNTNPLNSLRSEIDEIDANMIALLEKRLRISLRIGKVKQLQGIAIQDDSREQQILSGIEAKAFDSRVKTSISSIYNEVFNQSRNLQNEKTPPRNSQSGFSTVAVIGLGLIGGALARQIRQRMPGTRILAFDNSCSPIEALDEGVVDVVLNDSLDCVDESSLIILAATPKANLDILRKLAPHIRQGQLIVDVTSTKSDVCKQADSLELQADFIGGHPLFGSEKSGFANSNEVSVEGKTFLLTPTKNSSETSMKRLSNWLSGLGMNVQTTDAKTHDSCLAITSHLVQLVSVALGNVLVKKGSAKSIDEKTALSGPSFRNLSRLMASPSGLWSEILASNKEQVIAAIDSMQIELKIMRDELESGESTQLQRQFETASEVHKSLTRSA
jgi:prephenate dehydrogenase